MKKIKSCRFFNFLVWGFLCKDEAKLWKRSYNCSEEQVKLYQSVYSIAVNTLWLQRYSSKSGKNLCVFEKRKKSEVADFGALYLCDFMSDFKKLDAVLLGMTQGIDPCKKKWGVNVWPGRMKLVAVLKPFLTLQSRVQTIMYNNWISFRIIWSQ